MQRTNPHTHTHPHTCPLPQTDRQPDRPAELSSISALLCVKVRVAVSVSVRPIGCVRMTSWLGALRVFVSRRDVCA